MFSCKWGQGRSKKEINRATGGYLGVVQPERGR